MFGLGLVPSEIVHTHLKRPAAQLLPAQLPKRGKVLDDGIKLVDELEVVFLCKCPPVVEPAWWVPSIAALVLCNSLGEGLALSCETLGERVFRILHEGGDRVPGKCARAPRVE